MCGIVGVMSKRKSGLFHTDLDIFSDMLFADQLRGAHGTGMFYDVDGRGKAFKGAMPSSTFLRSEKTNDVLNEVIKKSNFVIGHNRHATKGGINFDSTHPFIERNITLIHNGTLPSHKHIKDVEVDSHAICHSISSIGHIETLRMIEGAFALVWFDNETRQLHFIRNSERPLHIVETDNLFVLSSEGGLADWICSRRNAKGASVPKMCKVGQLYTYDINTNKLTDEEVTLKAKAYKPPTYYGGQIYEGYDYNYGKPVTYIPPPATIPSGKKDRFASSDNIFQDVRIGDKVIFEAIEVNPSGKSFILTGLATTIIYDHMHQEVLNDRSQMIVKMWGNEKYLRGFLEWEECKAEVISVIWKNNTKSVVVKDPLPLGFKVTEVNRLAKEATPTVQ